MIGQGLGDIMKMSVKSQWDDKFWKRIEHDSMRLDGTEIEYGFTEVIMHPEAKVPVAAVAEWNNNGVRSQSGAWKIPARDFMQISDLYAQGRMEEFNEQIASTLGLGGSKLDKTLDYLSKELAELVQQAISEGDFKALAPSTISQKQSDTILIDSGFMFDAIKGKVNK